MITKDQLIQKRLSKTHLVGRMLARLPFVRCVILNGSLASGDHKQSSDIDILIIAKDKHVFTARFLINAISTILRIKRSKDDEKGHAGKFCFNYFLTENYLKINFSKAREFYCADNYSKSQFIAGNHNLFEKFMEENRDLFVLHGCHPKPACRHPELDSGSRNYLYRFRISSLQSGMTKWMQRIGESVFGNWFEKWVKAYQIKKIESDPRTHKYPELIVYNDRELRFHPPK